MNLIDLNIKKIIQLCKQYKVRDLSVFGSILTNRFNSNSDIDLLVNFNTENHEQWDYVDNYFGFRDALESLLGRNVDLIEEQGLKNPLLRRNVESSKVRIYG